MTVSAYDNHSNLFRSSCYGETFSAYLLVSSIEEPTDYFTHVISNIRFESENVSHKSDK